MVRVEMPKKWAVSATRQPDSAARVFRDFPYRTKTSWSRERRVVGKAEHLAGGTNPRFVVTSLTPEHVEARTLYKEIYCARGEAENRIKEQKLLFACRDSCASMRANQIRVLLSAVAYVRGHLFGANRDQYLVPDTAHKNSRLAFAKRLVD